VYDGGDNDGPTKSKKDKKKGGKKGKTPVQTTVTNAE